MDLIRIMSHIKGTAECVAIDNRKSSGQYSGILDRHFTKQLRHQIGHFSPPVSPPSTSVLHTDGSYSFRPSALNMGFIASVSRSNNFLPFCLLPLIFHTCATWFYIWVYKKSCYFLSDVCDFQVKVQVHWQCLRNPLHFFHCDATFSMCVRNHIYTLTHTHKHWQLPGSLYIIELRSHSRAIPIKALCLCLCLETSPICLFPASSSFCLHHYPNWQASSAVQQVLGPQYPLKVSALWYNCPAPRGFMRVSPQYCTETYILGCTSFLLWHLFKTGQLTRVVWNIFHRLLWIICLLWILRLSIDDRRDPHPFLLFLLTRMT